MRTISDPVSRCCARTTAKSSATPARRARWWALFRPLRRTAQTVVPSTHQSRRNEEPCNAPRRLTRLGRFRPADRTAARHWRDYRHFLASVPSSPTDFPNTTDKVGIQTRRGPQCLHDQSEPCPSRSFGKAKRRFTRAWPAGCKTVKRAQLAVTHIVSPQFTVHQQIIRNTIHRIRVRLGIHPQCSHDRHRAAAPFSAPGPATGVLAA